MFTKIRTTKKQLGARCSITRSYTLKLNCALYGGAQYESRDFFASQSVECSLAEAPRVSETVFQFCRSEVIKAVKAEIASLKARKENAA